MECGAAALAFVQAAFEIAKYCRKCSKMLKKSMHIGTIVQKYLSAIEDFGCLVKAIAYTIDDMIDAKLPALRFDEIKALIAYGRRTIREQKSLMKSMSKELQKMADQIPIHRGPRRTVARLWCTSKIKAVEVALCGFEPVKAFINAFTGVMNIQFSLQQYREIEKTESSRLQKLKQKM